MDRALFIGGPGTLSASAIDDLLGRGYRVGVFSTGKNFPALDPRVETMRGDRDDPVALADALSAFRPDVVVDFVLFSPAQAEQMLHAVRSKVRQYIFVSTVDVYGYPLSHLPLREDDPWHPETQSPYAENKRRCERFFKSHFDPGVFPLTIARPAYSFGPRFVLSFMSRDQGVHMLHRLQTGRPVMVPGDGTTLMHVSSAANTGKMIAALVDSPVAIGKDYTCGHPTFMTHEAYVELFARALGVTPHTVHIPTDLIVSVDHPAARGSLLHALTRFNIAFAVDRFLRDFPEFGWPTTLAAWAKATVEWNLAHGTLAAADGEILDDRLIQAWNTGRTKFLADLEDRNPSRSNT
jgi:nucleoside-diphosphate-sugar epimerase